MVKTFSTYATISVTDLSKIDFSQIGETSENTLRYNLAGTEFVIKWNTTPSFISDGSVVPVGDIMNQTEALELLATSAWSEPMPEE